MTNWITRKLKRFIQKYGCDHEYKFVRNLYGDQINQHDGARSVWECIKCGHIQYREDLHITGTLCEELDKLYDDYYKDVYKNWKEVHSETLNNMMSQMRTRAYQGECSIDIVLNIDERTNDKYHYEEWFDQQGLKYERECLTKFEDVQVKQYQYHIRWKYK